MKKTIATLVWIAGLCMAGAETEYFIVNVIGGLTFLFASIVIGNITGERSLKNG